MTSPRTLIFSIAATVCGFILALVGVIGAASTASSPAMDAAIPETLLIPEAWVVLASAVLVWIGLGRAW